MKALASACELVGLDTSGADWQGVDYHRARLEKQGLPQLLKYDNAREHFRASVESELGRPVKVMGESEPESQPAGGDDARDEEPEKLGTYSDAYKRVGHLMTMKRGKMSRRKAILQVESDTGWRLSNSAADASAKHRGTVSPKKRGYQPVLGTAGDQGNKQTKQGLLLPHVQSWYGDQPQTRTSTTDK